MVTLWGRTNSSNVMKVMWLLDELGVAHERIDAGGTFGRTDTAEYRAISPLGLVPALTDDAVALFESNAILRYLARAHAGHAFYPIAPAAAAPVDAWLDFSQTALARPAGAVFSAVVRTPPEQRDAAVIAASVTELARIWAVVDARLARHSCVVGDTVSLADVALGPHAHRWFAMPIERPDLLGLRAWYDRLAQRPAYARACMAPLS